MSDSVTTIGPAPFRGAQRIAAIVAVAGFGAWGFLATQGRTEAMQGYLLGYLYWTVLTLGSLALLLLQYLITARWGVMIRRLLEPAAALLPLMALLFLPIWFARQELYPWANPAIAAHDALIQIKAAYLNETAFATRTIAYFLIWIIISRRLITLSRQHDHSAAPGIANSLRRVSGPSLVIYSLTVTFAAFDWAMSLEPHWFSTIYGVIIAAGGAMAAMAFAIVVLANLEKREPLASYVRPETFGDLGNLTLAFTMFWTYVSLSQFLIIWSGHLPEETPWYYARMHNGWEYAGAGLFIFQFGLPFLLLIVRSRKRNIQRLMRLAMFILVMRFVDLFWLVSPAFSETMHFPLADLAAVAGIGGVWLWFYLRGLGANTLLPVALTRQEAASGGGHHG